MYIKVDIHTTDCFSATYKEIADEIGIEPTLKLFQSFNGQQLFLPKKLYNSEFVYNYIKNNYNGKNMKKIAKELGYTERRLWQILQENE